MAQRMEGRQQRKRPGQSSGPIRRKSCYFCKEKVDEIDYKNVNQLRRYISEKGKIRSRRITGACRRHQRQVAVDGRLDWREWEAQDGSKRQAVEIIANSVQFLGSRDGAGNGNGFQAQSDVPADTSDFEGAGVGGGKDDDIPF